MTKPPAARSSVSVRDAARQSQFLEVVSRDEAEVRFHRHLRLEPLGTEVIPLSAALGRVLAADLVSPVDVPGFDRSNVDGFAVRAGDVSSASMEAPVRLALQAEVLSPGIRGANAVRPGTATAISTGGMLPRGADAVVMVEHTDLTDLQHPSRVDVMRPVATGENVSFAASDIAQGETVLRCGTELGSRELGVVAAVGCDRVTVYLRPQVAILSTGDELVPPGQPLPLGCVYDSNGAILAASVAELGGEPLLLGVVGDDEAALERALTAALKADVVVLSGGTSKGAGDISHRVLGRLGPPGIVVHGVSLKPGKPLVLGVVDGKPVVVLPGFPTSAIFTFQEFVAPVIRALGGRSPARRAQVRARLPLRVNSDPGRTEYLLVRLSGGEGGLSAYPMGKGSGSVTTFSLADGFITIPQQQDLIEAGDEVEVTLLGGSVESVDLVVMTSHCVGLDWLLSQVQAAGFGIKVMTIGSQGALAAARRGECDLAGLHLLDPQTGQYNAPFVTPGLELLPGYRRMQSLVFRGDDLRWWGGSVEDVVFAASADDTCRMINRNAGSGTRLLIDELLARGRIREPRPQGYEVQVRSHNAVCAAVRDGRADWGIAVDTVARMYTLGSRPIREESFDFVVPASRKSRPAVRAFVELLTSAAARQHLTSLGFRPDPSDG
jgi:putative molybdopterin biosynthesis protein